MPSVKKWSTGLIGNTHPDHSERGNPNTRGLSIDGVPGIEGYIEEDRVVASDDNRPLLNLSQNDQILEKNLSSVASEVDYGVLRYKGNEFRIEVLPLDTHLNPEDETEELKISPIRIHSGQAIVDGQVTSVGNQQIIYFLRNDGSYLFPNYEEHAGKTVIPIVDDLYDGDYTPVYDTLSEGLPDNFENYEIKIINKYESQDDRILFFKLYRDWEDIVPYTPNKQYTQSELNFIYDENFGKDSNGVWLFGGDVDNVKISNVVVKKNIQVSDKKLSNESFIENENSAYEQYIITDGIFFDNIQWKTENEEVQDLNIEDLYVDEENNIYFIYEHREQNENLFYLPEGSTQVSNIQLQNNEDQAINRIIESNNILFILGSNGYFSTYDLINRPTSVDNNYIYFNNSTENFKNIIFWENQYWIATDDKIYRIREDEFEQSSNDFIEINVNEELESISGKQNILKTINSLNIVEGNFFVDSSLKFNKLNYVKNPSFEKGGVGSIPTSWDTDGTFEITSSNARYGSYMGVLSQNAKAYQDVSSYFKNGTNLILSTYLKSVSDVDVNLYIEEVDINGNVLTSSFDTVNVTGGGSWNRYNTYPYTKSQSSSYIRIVIENTGVNPLQIDGVQLEKDVDVHEFRESFSMIFVGFEKHSNEIQNPPFAFVDSKRIDQINYTPNMYGEIMSVNDAVSNGSNIISFVDNNNFYSLTFLNDEDEYNRISITNITNNVDSLNISKKIDRFNSIAKFDDRIFFGADILNKSISIQLNDKNEENTVELLPPTNSDVEKQLDSNVGMYYDIRDLLGEGKIIPAHDESGVQIEFPRIDDIYETRKTFGEPGFYDPGKHYVFAVKINNNQPHVIVIKMPELYNEPISVSWIYDRLYEEHGANNDFEFKLDHSKSFVDGLYSIGKNVLTQHIRGNIKRIFTQKSVEEQEHYNKGIYVILENTILHSKYDPNIKKQDGYYIDKPSNIIDVVDNIQQLPEDANFGDIYHVRDFGYYKWNGTDWIDNGYIHKWNLNETNHNLREIKRKYNQEVIFNDQSLNKQWIDLPVDSGYDVVPGSIRVKTNPETEIGFSEDEDYFIDYENKKIIRSTLENYLIDSSFEFIDSNTSKWQSFILEDSENSTINISKYIDSYESFNGETVLRDSFGSAYLESILTNEGVIYQYVKPASLNIGDTYTFSICVKSNKNTNIKVVIAETPNDSSSFETINDSSTYEKEIGELEENNTPNEWNVYKISHTITNSTSEFIRVELHMNESTRVFFKEAQLERNQFSTPYVKESNYSRIDPGMTVYVDFEQTKNLVDGVDYTFDTENRKVVYFKTIDDDTQLYFDYEYEKIFNPFLFETSIPKFDITTDLQGRDDYFLYPYSGRIWAINFVLALLSQDEENPLIVEYNYHYPRVDKIKIRKQPDQYGNFIYIVKGVEDEINPYGPYDKGTERKAYTQASEREDIEEIESNEMIYEINVVDLNYINNDIYDRRIYVESRDNRYFNISLYDQTAGYFPYKKDFLSTSGLSPINRLYNSKIVDIIKNFKIKQLEEVGAWGPNYQIVLRNKIEYPSIGLALFVDINSGDDSNGGTLNQPFKTISHAIEKIREGASPYIIVKSESLITENIEIDLDVSEVRIFAQTYARWSGNIQNKTPVVMQGFQFERHNFYVINSLSFYFCTFINSTINNYIPDSISFTNCRIEDGNNTFLYVKNTVFPSPFLHPYQKNASADDNIEGNPESVATSDNESIYPNARSYQQIITGNPSGTYTFNRCIINGMKDSIIKYDLEEDENWISSFEFNRCTIVNNNLLFYTNKTSQEIRYIESILWNNGVQRVEDFKYFDSESNIEFENCYLHFDINADSTQINFNPNGLMFGRETCIPGLIQEPGFISVQEETENYRLRSQAMGFLTDSPCIARAANGGDIGCYDELRERLDVEVPKKIKSYFALIGEGIHYPIILNSEKITFTLELKPNGIFSSPAVLFDTRSHPNDKDFIVVAYNNNSGEDIINIDQNEDNEITDPFTFKIIVANEKTHYAVSSPVEIYSDSDYQSWHKLSFTINYERTFNDKASFDEKDKYQNIITFFHNDELAVESFLKNDLNYDERDNPLSGTHNDGRNDWNYNNISKFVTLGSTYDQRYILHGYYSELRIDNKFINRKELQSWNNKQVPFNDPLSYIDEKSFSKTFENSIVNELWTLKTPHDIGAKGHKFNKHTNKRFAYHNGEFVWALTGSTTNYIENSDLTKPIFASVTTDVPPNNDSQNLFPISFNKRMIVTTTGDKTDEMIFDFTDSGMEFYSHDEFYDFLRSVIDDPTNVTSNLDILRFSDNRLQITTSDYLATSITVVFENGGDAEEFGFKTLTGQADGYHATDNSPAPGQKTITGQRSDSIEIISGISSTMSDVHSVWTENNADHTHHSQLSIGIRRVINSLNNNLVSDDSADKYIKLITNRKSLYQQLSTGGTKYTYSIYVYRKTNDFTYNDISFLIKQELDGVETETEQSFDSIQNTYGYWWRLDKTFSPQDEFAEIGFIVKDELEMYLDAVQLEEEHFASPFVPVTNTDEGFLEVDSSVLNKERGLIFFRFKPLFDYNVEEPRVLLELLSDTEDVLEDGTINIIPDKNKGFKVWYEYDKESDKGVIQFRSSFIEDEGDESDDSSWRAPVISQFWNDWHTIVLSYDFSIKRFIYFFDYFKFTADMSIPEFNFFTNLSIGRNAIWDEDSEGKPLFDPSIIKAESAGIYVKDLLVTNYVTSDEEITSWINSHEFYKETLFNTLLNAYKNEMLETVDKINNVSANTALIEQDISTLKQKVGDLESVSDSDIDVVGMKVWVDKIIKEIYDENTGILRDVDMLDQARLDHVGRINQNRVDNDNQDILIGENTDNIYKEVSDRTDAINNLTSRLNSNNLGNGASMIGVHDPNNKFGATNVEAVLIEIEDRVSTNEQNIDGIETSINEIETTISIMQHGDGSADTWTMSKAINDGWNIQSLRTDVNSNDVDISNLSTNLSQEITDRQNADDTLRNDLTSYIDDKTLDLAGVDRTTETIKGNYNLAQINKTNIESLQTTFSNQETTIDEMKDGLDGSNWNSGMNLAGLDSALAQLDVRVSGNETAVSENATTISENETAISQLQSNIADEILERTNADAQIISNLASQSQNNGASKIGIYDAGDLFTATNVEDALQEVDSKLQSLAGSLNWKTSVSTVSDLPVLENNINDIRIVEDDGDGKRAQYVWNGTGWIKISDVDWGTASNIIYDNTESGLSASDVKSAIDELYEKSSSQNTAETTINSSDWIVGNGEPYIDFDHNLGTINIAVRATGFDGNEIVFDEYERIDNNTVRIYAAQNIDAHIYVFGAQDSYSKIIGNWTPAGGLYIKDVVHNLGTRNIIISAFDIVTGERIGLENIETLDENAIRVSSESNVNPVNIFILRQASGSTSKDVENWIASNDMYEAIIPIVADYDAVYSFYEPSTGKTVGVDSVKISSGILTVRRTENTPIRMVILK